MTATRSPNFKYISKDRKRRKEGKRPGGEEGRRERGRKWLRMILDYKPGFRVPPYPSIPPPGKQHSFYNLMNFQYRISMAERVLLSGKAV